MVLECPIPIHSCWWVGGRVRAMDPEAQLLTFRSSQCFRLRPAGSDSSLEAQIEAWRLRFKPGGSDSSLGSEIQAWRLRFRPQPSPARSQHNRSTIIAQ